MNTVLRILILGNMANDGYSVAKELRKMNVDVDLAVNISDFGMALPEWEDAEIDKVDPYKMDGNEARKQWNPPSWIRYFDFKNKVPRKTHTMAKIRARIDLIKMIREYEIIEAHVPFSIYAQFAGRPYLAYDAGWIRYFPLGRGLREKLARRAYKNARRVIITNPDTYEISDRLPYLKQQNVVFSPFAIDPEKYKPKNASDIRSRFAKDSEILLFSPARQLWAEKGNDKMLRAFARFLKDHPGARFVMVSWSVDEERSKALANSLGVAENIHWIKPVPKNQLIDLYNAADVVLDQFVLGSWGTSTPEAMCCGKPVLIYYKEEYIQRAFHENPPILNSFSEEDIARSLRTLCDNEDFRMKMGRESREWVIKTHSSRVVAQRHLDIINSVLN